MTQGAPRSTTRRVAGARMMRRGLSALVALVALAISAPEVLAFPHHRVVGTTTIYSEAPAGARIVEELAHADALVATSPIAAPFSRRIFLTGGGWRWTILALASRNAFALRRPFGTAIVVNRSDVAQDRVFNGSKVGGVRTLSGVLAHETMHILVARRVGEARAALAPVWKREGYPDYVARESSLSDAAAARLRRDDPRHRALPYYEGRRRVAAALAANGGSVDRLFAE